MTIGLLARLLWSELAARRRRWQLPGNWPSSCTGCGSPVSRSNGNLRHQLRHKPIPFRHHGETPSLSGRASATARFFPRHFGDPVRDIAAPKLSKVHDAARYPRPRRERCNRQRLAIPDGQTRTDGGAFRPNPTSLPSCSVISRPSLRWPLKKRPALTCPARAGRCEMWLGRKKACGAVEQKKGPNKKK